MDVVGLIATIIFNAVVFGASLLILSIAAVVLYMEYKGRKEEQTLESIAEKIQRLEEGWPRDYN